MKNLLLLFSLMFLSFGNYLQAQDCLITSANTSADGNCLFVQWVPSINKPSSISSSGKQYFKYGSIGSWDRYSLIVNNSFATCDTVGMSGFIGKIQYKFSEADLECKFIDGGALAECPDNVQISESESCLVFTFLEEELGTYPDSVKLRDTFYYNMGLNPANLKTLVFLRDTATICDSSSMNSLYLTDTLFVGQKVCTYEAGILPITILAFDYENDGDDIALSWEVNSEEPAQKLYLQKSYDGVEWVNVYEQNLDNHIVGQTMDGEFKDVSVKQPKLYYRLSIAGHNGKSEYSNILPVTMKDQVINTLFYQSQSRSIMIKAGQNYAGKMHLINTHGQDIMTKEIRIQKNTIQEVNIQGQLTPGIYFVKFENSLIPPAKIFID